MTPPERATEDHRRDEVEDHDRGLLFDMQRLVGRRRALAWVGGTALAALAGCSASTSTTGTSSATTASSVGSRGHRRRRRRRHPGGDRRPLPGRRVQREERAERERRRAQRHPLVVRLLDDDRAGRSADDPAHAGRGRRRHPGRGRGGVPVALQPGRPVLHVRPGGDRRELPARRPGVRRPTAPSRSPASSRPATPGAGRTSTSRSTRASTRPRPPDRSSRPVSSPCRRTPARRVYATTGYEQSVSNLARVSLSQDMVFSDDDGVSQLATMTGDVAGGYTAALTVGL